MAELTPIGGCAGPVCSPGRSRASHYRDAAGPVPRAARTTVRAANKLTDAELEAVLDLLHPPEFVDLAPAQVWAILLDAGTLHGVDLDHVPGPSRPRRDPRTTPPGHPSGPGAPRAGRRGPNQVWSWDITKLRGPPRASTTTCT